MAANAPALAPLPNGWTHAALDIVNQFRDYRGERRVSPADIALTNYRGTQYVHPPAVPPIVAPPAPTVFPKYNPRRPKNYNSYNPGAANAALDAVFIAQTFTSLPYMGQGWRHRRMLGRGGQGGVGLWEWTGQGGVIGPAPAPRNRLVAVKEAAVLPGDLRQEYDMMMAMQTTGSTHIPRIVYAPDQPTVLQAAAAVAANGVLPFNTLARLYLEYYEQGDLQKILDLRISKGRAFSEATLWLLFNCLVDALAAMQNGAEATYNSFDDIVRENVDAGWDPIVHFDIKPGNILLGGTDTGHASTPRLVTGDFGCAVKWPPVPALPPPALLAAREQYRTQGTTGYFAPEQYTQQYEHSDWATNTIAGIYGVKTNVFQIGLVMSQLVVLRDEPLVEVYPDPGPGPIGEDMRFNVNDNTFLPTFYINGAPALDYTIGPNLRAYSDNNQYSVSLIDTIYTCLYSTPAHRPDVAALKRAVSIGQITSMADPIQSEIDDPADFRYYPRVDLRPRPTFRKPNKGKRVKVGQPIAPSEQLNIITMRCSLIIVKTKRQCRKTIRGPPVRFPECRTCDGTRDGKPAVGAP